MDEFDNLIELKPNKPSEPQKSDSKKEKKAAPREGTSRSKNKREITSITTQKRQGRYNIFIDGEYAFPVDEEILIRHMLRKGMVISEEEEEKLVREDQFYKAYQRALNYLSYGLRSEKEVRDDLYSKEFTENIDEVIEKLEGQRLIDDLEYAKSYTRTAALLNRKGPKVIAQDLKQRGIDPLKIEDALPEYPFGQQIENAETLIYKQLRKTSKNSERERVQKIKTFLMTKGYPTEVIHEALSLVDTDQDDEEEYEKLVYQGDKAWMRYSRKASGYELINKTKAYLYGKGFPGDMINRFIEEKEEEED